jgi:hypothetical protein
MEEILSPTGVAAMLILAALVDYLSVGPDSVRDRIAFLIALPMIHIGFNDTPVDAFTVDALSRTIDTLKSAAGGSYIAGAATDAILSVLVACLALYTVGAVLPIKASKRLGAFAEIRFTAAEAKKAQYRINTRLWVLAGLLGILADLPGGLIGELLRAVLALLTAVMSWVPMLLFGAS